VGVLATGFVEELFKQGVVIAIICLAAFALAYFVYARYISRAILSLDPKRTTPAVEREDGIDYVPTRRGILFGHHFATIAGLGPIVGPAIAVVYGWLPALLWVVFGTIFIGAVHDFSTLVVSLRHQGRSIGDVLGELAGPRARLLFLLIIFFLLALAMGVFALIIANLFVSLHPEAVIPVVSLIFIAMLIGVLIYRYKLPILPATLVGLMLMFVFIWIGMKNPVVVYQRFLDEKGRAAVSRAVEEDPGLASAVASAAVSKHFANEAEKARAAGDAEAERTAGEMKAAVAAAGGKATSLWIWVLLVYALVAGVLPVWLLLQPRDYLNSFKLYLGLAAIYLGLFVVMPEIAAPAVQSGEALARTGAPSLFPFLFIIIACGAVSGFHSLAASGTTARQLRSEADARLVGYGGMIGEGILAVAVILACAAGVRNWEAFYGSWGELTGGIAAKIEPFIEGGGRFISEGFFGSLPEDAARAFIAVVVVAFAMTTLDSGTRLLRYNVEELARTLNLKPLANRYLAALVAVAAIGFFALLEIGGKPAGFALWQLFGTTNQLLACLALLTVSIYLYKKRKPLWVTIPPLLFMGVVVSWAMFLKLYQFQKEKNWLLYAVGVAVASLTIWLVVEAVVVFARGRPPEEPPAPDEEQEEPPPSPPGPREHDDPKYLVTSGPQERLRE